MSAIKETPIKILLDTGIFSHSEFGEECSVQSSIQWGSKLHELNVSGFRRKPVTESPDHQKQIDALITVGRLIRENKVQAYKYNEIFFEVFRGLKLGRSICNALEGCNIKDCAPAIERSKFRQTLDFGEHLSKGGKKDVKTGRGTGDFTQIAFMKWLYERDDNYIKAVIARKASIVSLSNFEIDSLNDIGWFRHFCIRSKTDENLPDIFHLWTARRNNLDVLLTLDRKFCNFVRNIRNEKGSRLGGLPNVLMPVEFLNGCGVDGLDPVPMELDRVYTLGDIWGTRSSGMIL